jgi:hypothetical protein
MEVILLPVAPPRTMPNDVQEEICSAIVLWSIAMTPKRVDSQPADSIKFLPSLATMAVTQENQPVVF